MNVRCAECGHLHADANLDYICGCPCPERPTPEQREAFEADIREQP